MREALFILFVIGILIALTAVRYRKQIVAGIRIYRSLGASGSTRGPMGSIEENRGNLVRCADCGTWIPEIAAKKIGRTQFVCGSGCAAELRPN